MLTIDEFKKVEMRAGKVLSAEPVEGSEKLLKLKVDFGSVSAASSDETKEEKRDIRQVVSGIAKFITPEELTDVTCAFVTNLEPRQIMRLESQAMIMAISTEPDTEGRVNFSLLKVSPNIPLGTLVK